MGVASIVASALPARRRAPDAQVFDPNESHVGRELARRSNGSLQAAGYRVRQADADVQRRLLQPWQARAFNYYDLLGEIKYASQFYARMLSPLRLYVGKKNEKGDVEEVEATGPNAEIVGLLERIQDPGGGRSGLLGSYGRLMFLVGEGYLFVSKDKDTDEEQWEMLSTDELRITGSGYSRYRAPSMGVEEYQEPPDDESAPGAFEPVEDDDAVAYRLWRRHPRYSMLADATLQGVLDLCEELVLLTQAVRARARSRLAGSGILFIPEGISPKPLEPLGDEDPAADPFIRALTNAMMAPIVEEGTASAVVPLVVRASGDQIDKVRHVQIIDPMQLYPETGLRTECIHRIAIGLDMPPEELEGKSDANHWTVWMIDEQTWKAHGQPVAQQLCDDLTAAYFRPALRALKVSDWADFQIAYDATAVINHPDRGKDAKDLYDRRAIGKRTLRDATGFDDDDAPTDEELYEQLGVQIRDASLAVYGIPSVKAGGIEPAAGEVISPAGSATAPVGTQSSEVDKGPPAEPTGPDTPGESEDVEAQVASANGGGYGPILAERVRGAADLALWRARELAGARVKGYAKRDPESLSTLEGVKNGQACAALGRDRVHKLRANEAQLVDGAGDLIVDALRMWGIGGDVADTIAEQLERHAARTLYDDRPAALPAGFLNYLRGAVTAAEAAKLAAEDEA